MAVTGREALTGARVYLGNPPMSAINDGALMLIGQHKLDHYLTRLNLTSENWLSDFCDLPTQPTVDGVQSLNAKPNFGKPFMVETLDQADPSHYSSEIKIARLQDQDLFYSGPVRVEESGHVARVMSFYRQSGIWKVRTRPVGVGAARYRIWYQPNRSMPLKLSDNVDFLDNFMNLWQVDWARAALPYCKWDAETHARIKTSLDEQFADYRDTFETARLSLFHEDTSEKRIPWGASREEEEFYF